MRRHSAWNEWVEAYTRGGAAGPVNIAYSGVYQWWYTIGLRNNQDLYTGSIFLLALAASLLLASWWFFSLARDSLELGRYCSLRDTPLR